MIPEASKEATESHVFKIDNLCENVGIAGMEDEGKSLAISMKIITRICVIIEFCYESH